MFACYQSFTWIPMEQKIAMPILCLTICIFPGLKILQLSIRVPILSLLKISRWEDTLGSNLETLISFWWFLAPTIRRWRYILVPVSRLVCKNEPGVVFSILSYLESVFVLGLPWPMFYTQYSTSLGWRWMSEIAAAVVVPVLLVWEK